MRALQQSAANVAVNGTTTGAIGKCRVVAVGWVTHDDSGEAIEDRMADKIVKLRIFSDDAD